MQNCNFFNSTILKGFENQDLNQQKHKIPKVICSILKSILFKRNERGANAKKLINKSKVLPLNVSLIQLINQRVL